jgi:RNA polymerase sigma factor (sigma-70 family)
MKRKTSQKQKTRILSSKEQIKRVRSNVKLARYYAFSRPDWALNGSREIEDRLQCAFLGLCEASCRFEKEKGKFSTYAHYWIRGCTNKWSGDRHPVRIPRAKQIQMLQILFAAGRILARKGPNSSLLYIKWATERYNLYSCWTMHGFGFSEAEIQQQKASEKLELENLERLNERETLVIRFRFGINTEPRTLDYIGENILGGISRERVRQIQESALNKLRNQ